MDELDLEIKSQGLTKLLEFILRETWKTAPNFITIHTTVVEMTIFGYFNTFVSLMERKCQVIGHLIGQLLINKLWVMLSKPYLNDLKRAIRTLVTFFEHMFYRLSWPAQPPVCGYIKLQREETVKNRDNQRPVVCWVGQKTLFHCP